MIGTTVKVRVNPKNPSEYALMVDPTDSYSPWYKQGCTYNGWASTNKLSDWVEYSLDVPVPPRQFNPGDVVQSVEYPERLRVRDSSGQWTDVSGSGRTIQDSRVRERLSDGFYGSEGRLKLVGNVATLA
jgi:hypothetical protein